MINLIWNTTGRLDKASYNKERWRHFAFCLIPVALFVVGGAGLQHVPIVLPVIAWVAGCVLLTYYRYRFVQVMIRRLHDRNLSGKLLLLAPALFTLVIVVGVPVLVLRNDFTSSDGNWVSILTMLAVLPFIGFNVFLRFQMTREGTPGMNSYGPPPGIGQAQIF